jgi:pyridinium-3,5-biscarboxylic acid mononucleotide synthase
MSICGRHAVVDSSALQRLLHAVAAGTTSPADAAQTLTDLPYTDLGYAMVDHHRALRQGVAEVVLGQGKSVAQIVGIARSLLDRSGYVLITRVDAAAALEVQRELPALVHHASARTLRGGPALPPKRPGLIALITAGTSDLPIADECAETLAAFGIACDRITDVGVAGVHRLLAQRARLAAADVVICVAGMEGALPSAVGGLTAAPLIAVPTSTGYGAAFQGVAALLCALTSCASGITVCNIDNGFGAAFAAHRILQRIERGFVAAAADDERTSG